MITVFYTSIRPAHNQTVVDVIKRAHVLGYGLMQFAGWPDADIGYAGNPGPSFAASRENLKRCIEIQDACAVRTPEGNDWPHIIQSVAAE